MARHSRKRHPIITFVITLAVVFVVFPGARAQMLHLTGIGIALLAGAAIATTALALS